MRKVTLLMVCAWMLVSGISFADDNGIEFEITTDFFSRYVWRGQLLSDDPVWQPGISAAYENITVGIWGNMDGIFSGEFTEVDYYFDYSDSLTETIGYSFGYIFYDFPQAGAETQEIYFGLNLDTFLSPSVTLYHDIEDAEGYYLAIGAGYSIEELFKISEDIPVGLDISMNIGYGDSGFNGFYYSVSDSGLNDLTLSVGLPMEIAGWSVTPSVTYATLLDDDIRGAADTIYGDSDICYAGVSIGINF